MTFTAFDDTLEVRRGKPNSGASGSLFPYDHLRQGVEITNSKYLYAGTQPKLWAGYNSSDISRLSSTVDHGVKIITYGQAVGFIEYDGHQRFQDLPRFNPVSYVSLGADYPLPVGFNENPMQQEEAIIEPFTIPFRLKTNEGPIYSKRVHGEIEDGNNFLDPNRSANRIQQFIEIDSLRTPVYFLDMDQEEFGGIRIDRFITTTQRLTPSFDDTESEFVVKSIQTNDTGFTDKLISMDINNDEDLRPFKQKSSTAGFIYVGAVCGTDSVAFGGTTRGV